MLHIKLFPAEYGDCIILSIGKESQYNILIDGGLSKTYHKYIKAEIQHIKELGQKIGLMVCTHMDNDHICGLIQVLKGTNFNFIENVWYNGFLQIVNSLSLIHICFQCKRYPAQRIKGHHITTENDAR